MPLTDVKIRQAKATAKDVLDVLNRAVDRGAETVAINLRQRCSSVFRYGVATLRADFDPVAALKGAIIRPAVENTQPMSRTQLKVWGSRLVGLQLAHAEKNKVKAAYNHAQYLPERREMMQAWADCLDAIEGDAVVS